MIRDDNFRWSCTHACLRVLCPSGNFGFVVSAVALRVVPVLLSIFMTLTVPIVSYFQARLQQSLLRAGSPDYFPIPVTMLISLLA